VGGGGGREDTIANSKQLLALLLHCQRRFVASQWSHGQRCLFILFIYLFDLFYYDDFYIYAIDL
jgi:hypothetical protein